MSVDSFIAGLSKKVSYSNFLIIRVYLRMSEGIEDDSLARIATTVLIVIGEEGNLNEQTLNQLSICVLQMITKGYVSPEELRQFQYLAPERYSKFLTKEICSGQ